MQGGCGGTLLDVGNLMNRPKNIPERHCYDWLTANGWKVTRRGWPDFIAVRDGKVIFIEVKPYAVSPLKTSQIEIMSFLIKAGLDCYRYSPDIGLKPFDPTIETKRRIRGGGGYG